MHDGATSGSELSINLIDRCEINLLLLACHLDIIQLQVYNTNTVYIHLEAHTFFFLSSELSQNHLNYPGSSAQAITIKATPA